MHRLPSVLLVLASVLPFAPPARASTRAELESDWLEQVAVVERWDGRYGKIEGQQAESFQELEGWAFAGIVDVLFVSEAQEEDLAAADRSLALVERLGELLHHVLGHADVDFAC